MDYARSERYKCEHHQEIRHSHTVKAHTQESRILFRLPVQRVYCLGDESH